MNLKIIFSFALLCILIDLGFGQERKVVQFSGFVLNQNNVEIPYCNMIIKRRNIGTTCKINGFFSVAVYEGDTILYSAIGYKKRKVAIPVNIENGDYYRDIVLQTDTIMLKELLILRWNTYRQFQEEFVNMQINEKEDYKIAVNNVERIIEQEKLSWLNGTVANSSATNYRNFINQQVNKNTVSLGNWLSPKAWNDYFELLRSERNKR